MSDATLSVTTAAFLGTFASEQIRLLAFVPTDATTAAQVRALHLLAGEALASDIHDYWIVQIGIIDGGKFTVITREIALTGGLPANVHRRFAIEDPVLLARGDVLALRVTPRGTPAPLAGLSAIPEWGILSTRRSSNA